MDFKNLLKPLPNPRPRIPYQELKHNDMHIEYNIKTRYQLEPLISKPDVETLIRVFRPSHQVSKRPPSNGDPHRKIDQDLQHLYSNLVPPLNPIGWNLGGIGQVQSNWTPTLGIGLSNSLFPFLYPSRASSLFLL